MEESSKINTTNETVKNNKRKKILSIIIAITIVFFAVNTYAATQGYNNIFFIIRNLINNETEITDKEEILSDRDITISYQPIEIIDGLKIQINKLVIKENEALLYLFINEETTTAERPYEYKVYDITNEEKVQIGEQKSVVIEKELNVGSSYAEEIKLSNIKNKTNIIQLDVMNNSEEKLISLEINLELKEIDVISKMSSEFKKVSEVELKEVLSQYICLNRFEDKDSGYYKGKKEEYKNSILVEIANNIIYEKEWQNEKQIEYSLEKVNKVIKEITGKEIKEPLPILKDDFIYYNENEKRYEYEAGDAFRVPGLCLDISDINFKNGIYTITCTYCYPSEGDYSDNTIENLESFETKIQVKINGKYEYAKYCIVNIDDLEGKKIESLNNKKEDANSSIDENKINQNIIEETNTIKEENNKDVPNNSENTLPGESTNTIATVPIIDTTKVDNYASTMAWSVLYTPGLKTRVPSNWNVEVRKDSYSGIEDNLKIATVVNGLARGIDKETNEIIDSHMVITYFMPEIMDYSVTLEEYTKRIANTYGAYDSGTGYSKDGLEMQWREARRFDAPVNNPNAETYYYCHVEETDNGAHSVGYVIEIQVDNAANFKVTNIMNWIFGDIKTTSF